jgi:hypothetical protein
MSDWFTSLKADGTEDGMGCTCIECGATMFIFTAPFSWYHCGRTDAYVAPSNIWKRLTTPKLERIMPCHPSAPALTLLPSTSWDGNVEFVSGTE